MDKSVDELVEEGFHYLKMGMIDEALDFFQNLVDRFPSEPLAHLGYAVLMDNIGRESEAIPLYLTALEMELEGMNLRDALVGVASSYRTLGESDEACRYINRALKEFPEDPVVLSFAALIYYDKCDYGEAVYLLGKAMSLMDGSEDYDKYRSILRKKFLEIKNRRN